MKIIRLTRHAATQEQIAALQAHFGGSVQIEEINQSLPSDPRGAVEAFDQISDSADVVEAVLPLNLLESVLKFSEFSKRGGVLIRAQMLRTVGEDGSVSFAFDHYEVVKKVEVLTERL